MGLSIGLGFFIPIIPTALGHFGLDPLLKVWYVPGRHIVLGKLYELISVVGYLLVCAN